MAALKVKCPCCKRKVPANWLVPESIPVVMKSGKLKNVRAVLAECCSTIYIIEKEVLEDGLG